jgi:hypothetical protein
MRRGTDVLHKVGSRWEVKQHCTSVRNAEIVISNLEKLDKNPNAKVFGEAKKASSGRGKGSGRLYVTPSR